MEIQDTLKRIEDKLDLLLSKAPSFTNDKFLDVVEVADLFKVSQGCIYNWVSADKIKAIKANGRLLFSVEDVQTLIESKRNSKNS